MNFTHLHVHSEFSLLDGMGRLDPMVERAKELGMEALAITDHGNLYGAVHFFLQCKKAGIKPVLGMETYVAPGDHRSKTAADRDPFHLVLLAKNQAGWRNLMILSSKAHIDGYYYKPRVDHELLAAHSEGLVVLSGCLGAEVPKLLTDGRYEEAKQMATWYKETFSDYFLELQNHPIPELTRVNQGLIELGHDLDLPLVATNDLHYVRREHSYAHDLLLCIQTNSTIHDEKRFKFASDSFYLKSAQEMADLFPGQPDVIANTMKVADLCDAEVDFKHQYLPKYAPPGGKSAEEYLRELCWEGLRKRYPEVTDELGKRLEYELDVIRQTNFPDYFLVVWDILKYAREHGILYGVRGSAASSIVLYCLGITSIDPVGARLVFERFLNVERKDLPDIDMDFADDRRDEVIKYVADKYGYDHVAQIITFGTLGAKAAIRDVARGLGLGFGDGDRVARLVPAAPHMTIEKAMEENPELEQLYNADEGVRHLVDTAKTLEGVARHASTHAAGVVISQEPLMGIVPLQRPNRQDETGILMVQWPMEESAKVGLLKMDFLGLTNLTILGRARDLIKETRGIDFDLDALPWDDEKTYRLLAEAYTMGVFQLESPGMRRAVKDLQPHSIAELAALVALYRPGPMQHIPTYIESKFGRMEVQYPHEALKEVLEETYGVIVYQDQVLLILRKFAGYSLGRADIVRKAMGKKIAEMMAAERTNFLTGAKELGYDERVANEIFDLIEPFAGYAFNKAHATCYALIAYQTAYLKANYPAEYMCALLGCTDTAERFAAIISECARLGVTVLPPDINRSRSSFTVERVLNADGEEELAIRFGMAAIKGVGEGALEALMAVRDEGGPFASVEDFCRRADLRGLNKRALEALIKVGCFDQLGKRGALLAGIDRLVSAAQQQQKLRESGQSTMFDLWGDSVPVPMEELQLPGGDVPVKERLGWEKELIGVYISEHPFASVAPYIGPDVTPCGEIDDDYVGRKVQVAGIVAEVRVLFTNDRRQFASVMVEDLAGSIELTVWPEQYEKTKEFWAEGEVVLVRGKVSNRRGTIQLSCDQVQQFNPVMTGDGDEPMTPVAPMVAAAPPRDFPRAGYGEDPIPYDEVPAWGEDMDEEDDALFDLPLAEPVAVREPVGVGATAAASGRVSGADRQEAPGAGQPRASSTHPEPASSGRQEPASSGLQGPASSGRQEPASSARLEPASSSYPDRSSSAHPEPVEGRAGPASAAAEPVEPQATTIPPLRPAGPSAQPPVQVAPQPVIVKPVPAQRHAVATSNLKPAETSNGHGGGNGGGPRQPKGVCIQLYETSDPARDVEKLNAIINVLTRHAGPAPVSLTVFSGGSAVPLELPGIRVQVCQGLVDELVGIAGPSSVIADLGSAIPVPG